MSDDFVPENLRRAAPPPPPPPHPSRPIYLRPMPQESLGREIERTFPVLGTLAVIGGVIVIVWLLFVLFTI